MSCAPNKAEQNVHRGGKKEALTCARERALTSTDQSASREKPLSGACLTPLTRQKRLLTVMLQDTADTRPSRVSGSKLDRGSVSVPYGFCIVPRSLLSVALGCEFMRGSQCGKWRQGLLLGHVTSGAALICFDKQWGGKRGGEADCEHHDSEDPLFLSSAFRLFMISTGPVFQL